MLQVYTRRTSMDHQMDGSQKLAEFETMRSKYEASSTARQESVKIESTELAGYQKGDNFQSDDEKAAATKNWSVVKTN